MAGAGRSGGSPVKSATRPEVQLLLRCARLHPSQEALHRIAAGLAQKPDWRRLLELAERHRLTALLAHHLSREGLREHLPSDVAENLRSAYRQNAARNLRGRFELRRVLREFAEHEIRCVVLKGASLLESLYSDLALRHLSDLDLMVGEQDLERSYDLVQDLGYRPYVSREKQAQEKARHRHYPRLIGVDDGLPIELHRHLMWRESLLYFDVGPLWQRARETTIVGQPALVLAPEDLLAHLCLHFFVDARSYYPSRGALMKLVDISETIRRAEAGLDWTRFVRNVDDWGLGVVVGCVLLTVERLLGTATPKSVLEALGSSRLDPALLDLYVEHRALRETPWLFHQLVMPAERGRWNEFKSACRRLIWYGSPPMEQHRAMGRSTAELAVFHVAQVMLALGHYVVAPSRLRLDFRIYHWLDQIESGAAGGVAATAAD